VPKGGWSLGPAPIISTIKVLRLVHPGIAQRALVFAGILLLHLLTIRALWMGLANSDVRSVQTILQIDVVPADRLNELPLPLPAMHLQDARAIQVVIPEINIPIAEDLSPPIQATSLQAEFTAPPGPPAASARPVAFIPDVRPRPIYVPGGWERYPAESIRAHEAGVATITICISATGAVDSVQVTMSSRFSRLDQAAIGIGKEARFKPARLDGKPVPFCVPYRITFAIRNS
jgi:TonB family protein